MKYLEYKGYTGSIEYSTEDKLLFGRVLGIKGLISYEGKTGLQLERNFKSALEEYFNDCINSNIKPDKPFKGSFNVRIPPGLHREVALEAISLDLSINAIVTDAISSWVKKRIVKHNLRLKEKNTKSNLLKK